jgi:hypothetical protein
MARDYISTYCELLAIQKSNGMAHRSRPRQVDLNGGNGLAPVSLEEPLSALIEVVDSGAIPL